MMDYQKELEEIRKIREAKYSGTNSSINKEKPIYNYNERKSTLDYIKKCTKSDVIKERMDKNEKLDYKNKISKISMEDLDYFSDSDFNTNIIIDLFRFNFNTNVLEKAYEKYLSPPHITMIKEYLSKPKINEDFLLKLISNYTSANKNYINLILSTNILETNYTHTIDFIMDKIYSDPNITMTYEQIKMICLKTNITPEKVKFLITRCSNISAYSKCSKTWIEKPNRDLIKVLIRDMEIKYKCKIDIDLYNI
jgi:hypothetical protein